MALSDATFTLTEWSGASSPGFMRIGMPFTKGDVPSGSTVILKRGGVTIDAQFDQRTTWTDGSLKFAVCAIRDTAFSANEARTYVPTLVPSSSWNNAGTKTIANITAAHTFNVLFQNVTTYDGTTTASLGSGRFTLDTNTVLNQTIGGVATRLTKIHSGIVCETWMAWGMATDVVGGAAAKDLKGYVYVTIWKNADQTVADFEHAVVVSQDWWGAASGLYAGPKYRLNYDATYQDGSTVIQAYSGIQHPYNSTWITCRMQNDNNSGRRQWVTKVPTLGYQPSRAYWVATRLVPPLNYSNTFVWGAPSFPTYVPCQNVNVPADIDGTGGSNARGTFMNTDCVAFLSQIQDNVRIARLSALSALGVPFHYRSNRTRTRPQDAGQVDIASSPISQKLDPQPAGNYDFTAQGMPIPVWAYAGGGPSVQDSYVSAQGGQGVWTTGPSAAHASPYCYFTYMLEGERYNLEALQDLSSNLNHQTNGDDFGGRPELLYYNDTALRAAFNIPSAPWSATGTIWKYQNARAAAWSSLIFSVAAAFTPDADAQGNVETAKAFFVAMNAQAMNYAATSMNYMPTSVKNAGWWAQANDIGWGINSPWQHNFITMGAYHNYQLTEDPNAKIWGDMMANSCIGLCSTNIWRTNAFRMRVTNGATAEWNATTNDWLDISLCQFFGVFPAVATDGTMTLSPGPGAANAVANGDYCYVVNQDGSDNPATVPPELNIATKYYVVQASINPTDGSGTFKLSLTPGGSAITFSTTYAAIYLAQYNAAQTQTPAPTSAVSSDSFVTINRAAVAYAQYNGKTGAAAAFALEKSFLSLIDAGLVAGTDPAGTYTWFLSAPVTSGPSLLAVATVGTAAPFLSSQQIALTGTHATGAVTSITNWQFSLVATSATGAAVAFAAQNPQPHLIGVQAIAKALGITNLQSSFATAASAAGVAAFSIPKIALNFIAVHATGGAGVFVNSQFILPGAAVIGTAAGFASSQTVSASLTGVAATAGVGSFSVPIITNYTLNAATGFYALNPIAASLNVLQAPAAPFQFDESYATPFTPANQVQFIAYNPFLRQLYVQYWNGSVSIYQNVQNGNVPSIIAALNRGLPPTQVFNGLST